MDKCRSCRHYIIKERSGDMCIWGCELSTCVINDFGKTLNGEPVIVYASELKYGDAADMKTHVNLKIIEELEKIKHEIGKEFVDLQDGSEEWRGYVNDSVLSCYEIVENRIHELKGENNET